MRHSISVAAAFAAVTLFAAPFKFDVAADRADCRYACGEEAVFTVKIVDLGTDPTNRPVTVTLDNFGSRVFFTRTVDAAKDPEFTVKGTLCEPGILRLKVCDPAAPLDGFYSIGEGNASRAVLYEPEKIRLEERRPVDFDAYWDGERRRLAETVPFDVRMEPVPEASTNGFSIWRISAATFGGVRVQGIVAEPKAPGRYPVHIRVPGAGPAVAIDGMPRLDGVVNVMLNVFSHPATATREEAKRLYPGDSYFARIPATREDMRFHDMMLGMDRLIDWIAKRPNADSGRILYSGGSQGGAYGLLLMGMNRSITRGYVWIPALGDQHGFLRGRKTSAPAMLEHSAPDDVARVADIIRYYDSVFFAGRIRIPVRVYMGLADTVCTPFSIWAAYNAIPSADKAVDYDAAMGHGMSGRARKDFNDWLFQRGAYAATGAEKAENILPNPEFDEPLSGKTWTITGKGHTLRMETAAMSREWIIRTLGESYDFLRCVPPEFLPDTDYTIEVKARGFGGESVLNILELYRQTRDGKVHEGAHVAHKVVLGKYFHTFYFPFRSAKEGQPLFLNFYKWDPRDAQDRGIDIASVRMFKGRISPFQTRRIARTGRKAPVGRAVPMKDNPYGRRREAKNALVFVRDYREIREVRETFAGMNVQADVLVTTGPDQDIYETDDDPEVVQKRIASGGYSIYCVFARSAANIGPDAAAKIEANVKAGAGMYMVRNENPGRFASLLAAADLKPLGAAHPFVRMFPGCMRQGLAAFDPATMLGEGRYGKGRIFADLRSRPGDFKFMMAPSLQGKTDFPFSDFADPAFAWLLYRAADREASPQKSVGRTLWTATDAGGTVRLSGSAADADTAFAAAQAAVTVSGRHAVALRTVDGDGFTRDWEARYFTHEGPTVALEAIRASCDGDEPAVFRVKVEGALRPPALEWTLEDFSGRIIERGTATPGATFEVPVRALYTNMGVLRLALKEAGILRGVARAEVYARDRDFARLYGDFAVGVWGQRSACSRETFTLADRQLEDIGVRWQCMPLQAGNRYNFAASLANGMAVSGGYLGESRRFVAQKLDGGNNRSRYGAINTAAARRSIAKGADLSAADAAPYGPVGYTVCDEPNLAERFMPDEPDEEPENIAEFRVRMEQRYGTIAAYNARHGTRHRAFCEIGPVRLAAARATGNFAEYVEWRTFNVDRWCEVLNLISASGRKSDPRLKMSLFNSFGQTAASGNDYWKLLTKAGLDFSNEYTAMVSMRRNPLYNFDEFYRSFRPDMRVWGFMGYGVDGDKIAFAPWWLAAHRYGGLTWFSALGWGYHLMDSPSLALTRDAVDLKAALEDSRMMDGLGKLFLAYGWLPRQAAIYYSHESMLVSTLLGKERLSYEIGDSGPLHDYMHSRQGVQYLLEELLYQHDFVAPEQVLAGALSGRRILFMPRIIALSDAEVSALKTFAGRGGKIVADQMPGDYDELGVKRAANPFAPGEVEVTGRNFDDLDPAQHTEMVARLSAAKVAPVLSSPGIERLYGREAMAFTDGTNRFYAVIRMPPRSTDSERQRFSWNRGGHVYDMRAGKYLGHEDSVEFAVPRAGASVWSVLQYRAESLRVNAPATVKAGTDLVADISLEVSGAARCGTHVFHVEVVPPSGECRFHMKRNLSAPGGRARLVFRMAENDPAGEWTLRAYDPLTGLRAACRFRLAAAHGPRRVSVVMPAAPRARAVEIAAAEFAKYSEKITGERPASVGTAAAPGTVAVRIGVPDADMAFDPGHDSYRIRSSVDGGVTLVGGNPRSTLYAVYDFLERRGGCRWFWDGDVVPRRGEIDFSRLDVCETARFDYRAIQYFAHRGLVRFEPEGWGMEDWKREIDWCVKSRLNFFMMQIGMDDIFQKAFPDIVPYPDPSKTEWCDSKHGFDQRSPFWPLEYRGRLRKAVLDYARERGMMHPAKFGTQTHWFSRTPKAFLDRMKPDFLDQSTGAYAERSGLVWDVRQKKWEEAYWRLTEAEIENYGYDNMLFTPGFDERMCSTNRAENFAIKKRFNRLFIDEAYRRHPDATVLIEGWDLYGGWWPEEIRDFLSELDPKRTIVWDYTADATRLSRALPFGEQKHVNDITHWGIKGRFPYIFGVMLAYDHATDIRANYPLVRERLAKVVDDPMCRGFALWPETAHSDILALRYLAENAWRPSGKSTDLMLRDFCADRYGSQAEQMRKIWADALPISRLADWRRVLPLELMELPAFWNDVDGGERSLRRTFFGDFTNGVPHELRKAPEMFAALSRIDWCGEFVRRDAMDLARTVADRLIVRAGRELVRIYRTCGNGDAAACAELKRKTDAYMALGASFAELLALHPDFSLTESLERIDVVEKIRNPDFERIFFKNTGGSWYCRSHQYEFAAGPYREMMNAIASVLVKRVDARDFSPLPGRLEPDPFARMSEETHPIRTRRPRLPRSRENWTRVLNDFARLAAVFVGP